MCLSPLTSVLASALSFPPNPPPPVCTGRPTARKASREQHRGHGFRSRLVRVGGHTRARGLVEVNAVAGSCVLFFFVCPTLGLRPVFGGGGRRRGAACRRACPIEVPRSSQRTFMVYMLVHTYAYTVFFSYLNPSLALPLPFFVSPPAVVEVCAQVWSPLAVGKFAGASLWHRLNLRQNGEGGCADHPFRCCSGPA